MARPSRPTLTSMAPTVSAVGSGREKPSVYLRPTAQATSNRPARNRMIQDMGQGSLLLLGGPSRMVTRLEWRGRPRGVGHSARSLPEPARRAGKSGHAIFVLQIP